jgi:hypothetical protein
MEGRWRRGGGGCASGRRETFARVDARKVDAPSGCTCLSCPPLRSLRALIRAPSCPYAIPRQIQDDETSTRVHLISQDRADSPVPQGREAGEEEDPQGPCQ